MPRADLLDRARRIGAVLLALPELAARVDLIASGLSGVARLASRVGAVRVGVEDLRAELAAVRVEVEALRAERDAAAQRARDVLDDAAARIASNHASLVCVCGPTRTANPDWLQEPVAARWSATVPAVEICENCYKWRGDIAGTVSRQLGALSRVVEALEPRPRVRPTLAELVRDEEAP